MVFTSHIFVYYYLPLLLVVYYNLPFRWRNAFLTVMSYVFYGWWNPWFTILMLSTTLVNYGCGKMIAARDARAAQRRAALAASVIFSLGALGFFKYSMFFTDGVNRLLALGGADLLPVLRVTLPIGISFYTFQSLSYTVDVYRGDARGARSFLDFACFVSMFPQLIAGPIIRYRTVAQQLVDREHTLPRFSAGTSLFILGFAKKILLANPMGEAADAVFSAAAPAIFDAWFGIVAYAFQIYFDFSAYSDMAVGLGRMLGFEFPKNFNAPYLAESITDFWRRWHISLSTFLRDYLYIPLGGNRRGPSRTYVNLATVMVLGGLWHGANWTFLVWGAMHGALLMGERRVGKNSLYRTLPKALRIAITFVLVLIAWVFFRAENLAAAGDYLRAMFAFQGTPGSSLLLAAELYTARNLAVMAICVALTIQPLQAFDWSQMRLNIVAAASVLTLFLFALAVMSTQAFNPFLYFQF
jgi:alginate O-acetyltransferase complex protein AlgI